MLLSLVQQLIISLVIVSGSTVGIRFTVLQFLCSTFFTFPSGARFVNIDAYDGFCLHLIFVDYCIFICVHTMFQRLHCSNLTGVLVPCSAEMKEIAV